MKLQSLHARILLAIVGILVLSLSMTAFFFSQQAKANLLASIEQNAQNLLNVQKINIESQYKVIQDRNKKLLEQRKIYLKENVEIALKIINNGYSLYRKRFFSLNRAKNMVLSLIKDLRYAAGSGYFWVNDTGRPWPRMIMHPTIPSLNRKILNDVKFNCALGKNENLFKAFVDICLKEKEGFVDYLWPKPMGKGLTKQQPKISFAKLFQPWNWIIGTGLYVDDIKKDFQDGINNVIKNLNKTITKHKIGKSGYFFIFNESEKLLVHPYSAGEDGSVLINPSTGNKLLVDLKKVALSSKKSLKYLWDKPSHPGEYKFHKKIFITYYKPLKWYIGSSIYLDDSRQKVSDVAYEVILFTLLFLLVAIIVALVVSNSISKPLDMLTVVIEQTDVDGIPLEKIPEIGTAEIKALSVTINKMIESVKDSRNELETESLFLQRIIEKSPSIICSLNSEGIINFINPTGEKITGYKKEDIIGMNWWKLFYPGSKIQQLQKVFLKKDAIDYSMTLTCKDGEERIIIWNSYSRKDKNKKIIETFGFGDDITDKIKLQEQLSQSRKMDAIGQLAGGVAHDFNNMLTGIIGATEMLQAPARNLDERAREYTDMILQTSFRAADLTAKLLAFGRKGNIVSVPVDVNSIIEDTISILNKTIDKRIIVSFQNEAKNHIIIGDNSGLQNALINLGINSSHAMLEGGSLSFATKNISLNATYCEANPFDIKPGEYISIDVRDTGVGISPDIKDRIFEPFFTTKKQGKGTGLGLAAVYGLVQDLHGAISVYSEEGEGTLFQILLPCSQQNIAKKEANDIMPGKGRILLVDDEELILIIGKEMLELMGYEVIVAQDGVEALKIFEEQYNQIDLILMDMMMPKMNGKEVFLKMKEIDYNCKVIISSGFTKKDNLKELFSRGLAGFIHKPFRDYELSKLLNEVM